MYWTTPNNRRFLPLPSRIKFHQPPLCFICISSKRTKPAWEGQTMSTLINVEWTVRGHLRVISHWSILHGHSPIQAKCITFHFATYLRNYICIQLDYTTNALCYIHTHRIFRFRFEIKLGIISVPFQLNWTYSFSWNNKEIVLNWYGYATGRHFN